MLEDTKSLDAAHIIVKQDKQLSRFFQMGRFPQLGQFSQVGRKSYAISEIGWLFLQLG